MQRPVAQYGSLAEQTGGVGLAESRQGDPHHCLPGCAVYRQVRLDRGIHIQPSLLQSKLSCADGRISFCLFQGGGVGAGSRYGGNRLHSTGHLSGSDHPRSYLQEHQRLPRACGERVAAGKTPLDFWMISMNRSLLKVSSVKGQIESIT